MKNKTLRFLLLGILCFYGMYLGNAFAADPINDQLPPQFQGAQPSTQSGSPANSLVTGVGTDGASQISAIADAIDESLKNLTASSSATSLAVYGLEMLGLFFALNVIWLFIKGMATGRMLDAFLSDILPLGVGTVAAYLFINGGDGQTINITDAIQQTMDAISGKISPDSAGKGLGFLISNTVGLTLTTIVNVMNMNTAKIAMGIKDIFDGAFTVMLFGFLLKWVAVIGSAIFILIAMGIFLATLVLTQITVTIAMVFMPIFVPFLIFKPLSGLFDTWLKFFVTACFTKVIGLLMLSLTSLIMTSMVKISQALQATELSPSDALTFNMVQYSVLILMSALIAVMMAKVPSLAGGLVGGSGVGFGGWSELNRGIMNQGPMGGMGKQPHNVGQGGKSVGSPSNMTSGVTAAMPNALKPISNSLGSAASNYLGSRAAGKDIEGLRGQQHSFVGPQQAGKGAGGSLGRDISNMSSAAQNAYTKHVESVNAASSAANFTIPAHVSSTSAKHPDNVKSESRVASPSSGAGSGGGQRSFAVHQPRSAGSTGSQSGPSAL